MSENTPKFFKMTKAIPGNVVMIIHPFSNPELSKVVKLTHRNPSQNLPLDWALGIFMNNESYNLYKKGIITFDRNEELAKEAYENGAYFSDVLEFEPSTEKDMPLILDILKKGNRQAILNAIEKYGNDKVRMVAIENLEDLSQGVVTMLEGIFKIQLTMDGGNN